MPRILIIIGKSILCFIGLAAAGWGIDTLSNFILHINKSIFLIPLLFTFLQYAMWFFLGILYSYVLFLMFKNEKSRLLIMALNGISVLLPLYAMFYLHFRYNMNFDISYAYFRTANTGFPVIALAFMFKGLSSGTISFEKKAPLIKRILIIILKSALCFILLIAGSWTLFYLFTGTPLDFIFDVTLLFSLLAISYPYLLYSLVRKYRAVTLIMTINAVFLLVAWAISLYGFGCLPCAIACGNTALVTVVLAFIFRSVEKRGKSKQLSCSTGDSSVADAPSE